MGNMAFVTSFPTSYAHFLPFLTSDHTPAVFVIPEVAKAKPKPFKFHNYLTGKDGFTPAVKKVWDSEVNGFSMFSLVSKLKILKKPLRKLNFDQGNLFANVERLRQELASIQAAMVSDPFSSDLREAELLCLKAFKEALKDEELFLRQKSKIEWLSEGDCNSKYFHNVVKGRINRGRISMVEDMCGIPYFGSSVGDQFDNHFQSVLGKCSKVLPLSIPDLLFTNKLSEGDVVYMIRDISDNEIKAALFDIDNNQALGPDGKLLKEGCLDSLVDQNQSAFIPSRQISNNVLLSQELLRGYHRKRGYARCAFKVDIQKAYDSVEWSFLRDFLNRFGFHSTMIKWIMECITSTSFLINVTGDLRGFFKGKRGLRQGDPLSSYLFTLIMEVLNLIIKRNIVANPHFKYHWKCKDLKITHLCFADDLMLFCHGDSKSVFVLKNLLNEFGNVSGLFPSFPKSTVFFGNVRETCRTKILEVMPFIEGKLSVRHLGVPILSKRLYVNDCFVLVDKVKKGCLTGRISRCRLMGDFSSTFQLWVLCRDFKRGKARIKCADVCKPKVEGGLELAMA
ncbi:putative RNA-directed DNA polymerase, eukaryota, reverse transcriptase zinc-binding domain protein [Tanacetum coccineum]